MKQALVLSDHDLASWRASHALGERPSALPYGAERIEQRGIRVLGSRGSTNRHAARLWRSSERRVGLQLERPLRAVPRAAQSSAVIALLENHAFLPALFKAHSIPPYARRPLVALSCWLAQDAATARPPERRALRRRVEAIDLLFYLSSNQTDILTDLGLEPERLLAVPYGVDADFYSPSDDGAMDIDVLAVGHDRGRDYATLFQAVKGAPFSVDLVCSPYNLRGLIVPENVRVRGQVDHLEYRALMHRAKVVAVPTHELAYPTGQSVALEASACGKCVVVSATTPLREYFDDGETAILVSPRDSDCLRMALGDALSSPDLRDRLGHNARRSVIERFTTSHMWDVVLDRMTERNLI